MAIVTITRGIQSGGRKFAHQLAERLKYDCLSREIIATCARKYNIPEEDLYHRLVEAPSRWRKLTKDHYRYLMYIQCSLIDAAKQDNVVYHGYAGQLFLRGVTHAMKVRLEAPLADRVEAEMKEHNRNYDDALAAIQAADAQRDRWVKFLYNEDWHDAAFYDLSINLKAISLNFACETVAALIEGGSFATTEQSQRRLKGLSLECEIKAAIASDDNLWDQKISVQAEGSQVTLFGQVKNKRSREAMLEIAAQVKGVTTCNDKMHLPSEALTRGRHGGPV
ncbi:MAG: cytidylate kinase family protein [bacterium]